MSTQYEQIGWAPIYRRKSNPKQINDATCCMAIGLVVLLGLVILVQVVIPIVALANHWLEHGNINYILQCRNFSADLTATDLTATYTSSGFKTSIFCADEQNSNDENSLCICLCGMSFEDPCYGDDSNEVKFSRDDYYQSSATNAYWKLYNWCSVIGVIFWIAISIGSWPFFISIAHGEKCKLNELGIMGFIIFIGLTLFGIAFYLALISDLESDSNKNSNQHILLSYLDDNIPDSQCINGCEIDIDSISVNPKKHDIISFYSIVIGFEVVFMIGVCVAAFKCRKYEVTASQYAQQR